MPKFSDIIGQESIKEHIKTAIRIGKVSHAYIFSGEAGSGKGFIARTYAEALLCDDLSEDYESCGVCPSCVKVLSGNHPDLITVTHEKPNIISVDEIRAQVVNDVDIKPYYGGKKIYIIPDAHKMTPQAQNALLKTLEEPPEYIVIMLLADNESMLLNTIASRCINLKLRPIEDRKITDYLMKEMKIPDYQAGLCVAFARGNIGKARNLAASEDFDKLREQIVNVLKYIHQMDVSNLLDAINELSEQKMNADDLLDIMIVWYRDVLMYKTVADDASLVFKDRIRDIRNLAAESTYEGIEEILKSIDKTKARLKANVSFELAIELLLMKIKEN